MPDRNSHFTGRGAGSWSALASCVGALMAVTACGATPPPSPSVPTGLPADWPAQAIRESSWPSRRASIAQVDALQFRDPPRELGDRAGLPTAQQTRQLWGGLRRELWGLG